jgi:hypothetical protein
LKIANFAGRRINETIFRTLIIAMGNIGVNQTMMPQFPWCRHHRENQKQKKGNPFFHTTKVKKMTTTGRMNMAKSLP